MEERDYEESSPVDIRFSVDRFEEMVKEHKAHFFDVITFEHIVNFYEQKEEWKKAIEVLDYAIEQHPFSPWFLTKKAGLLIYFKKYKQALSLLEQAETMDPSDVAIHILRADIYVEKSQHADAVVVLEQALSISDEPDRESLPGVGRCIRRLGSL
jgi:tetratricopeptide (TPR) repeat protein